MDKAILQKHLQNLSNTILGLDQRAAQRLQDLSRALDDTTQARTWTSIDLQQVINPDVLAEQYAQLYRPEKSGPGQAARFLEGMRNVLIFLPIVITWLGVSQATNAYHQLISQCIKTCKDQVQQPFLYLWEQGFGGGFPDFLRLSNIGLIDAGILALIFLATFYLSIVSARSNYRDERAEQQNRGQALALRAELLNALADATLFLHKESASIVAPIDKLDDVAKHIVKMSSDILNQFDQLKASFTTVADEMRRQFTTSQDATAEMLRQIGTISTMIHDFQVALDLFKTASEKASERLADLVHPIEQLTLNQHSLLDRVNESADHLKHTAQALDSMRSDQKDWGEKIANTLEQQDDVIGKLDTIANTFSTLEKDLASFLVKLGEEREAQEQQALQIAGASRGFAEALAYTRDEATQIRSIAVDTRDVVNMMARLSGTSGMDMSSIFSSYGQAALTINQSANALKETAMVVTDAALELKSAVAAFKATIP
jgi:uncharacterized coiled-coil DUF342 family protein